MNDGRRDAVLIIDDDPEFRTLVEVFAGVCNVPVLQAADCQSGLQVLEENHDRIKVVLLDYFMPGMPPPTCAAAIRTKAGPRIRIVLITAAADPAARAAELCISRWVAKPLEMHALTNLLVQP